VAEAGERLAPADPRGDFYRGVALVMKKEKTEEAERLLREYLKKAPKRSGYPTYSVAHEWLGKLFEEQNQRKAALLEYQEAVKLDPKNKIAHEGLKRMEKN